MRSNFGGGWGRALALAVGLALAGLAVAQPDKPGSAEKKGPPKGKSQADRKGRAATAAPPRLTGEAFLRTYSVPGGNAEVLARLFQEIYQGSPAVRIIHLGNDSLMVWAGPEDQLNIAKQLPRAGDAVTDLIPLTTLDATRTAETLKGMFGGPRSGRPFIEAEATRNALIVRGSEEQVQEIRNTLRSLGETAHAAGNLRVIMLERGSAATMAEALQELVPQIRANPVRVVLPGRRGGAAAAAAPAKPEAEKKELKGGKAAAPVVLTALGNRLLVTTDDPQALALVVELSRLLQAPAADGDFEVVRLKFAKASEVAQVLDEAFNGPPLGTRQNAARGRVERVRIVADPATNSLLVKASPLDTLTIRNLLSRHLDNEAADTSPPRRGTGKSIKK